MDVYESTLENLVRALDELHEIIGVLSEFTWLGQRDPVYLKLKQWVTRNPQVMEFYVFKEIKRLIEACNYDPESELEVDLIKPILDDTHGADLVGHAEEIADLPPSWDSTFDYFEDCERKIGVIRRRLAKHEPGKD